MKRRHFLLGAGVLTVGALAAASSRNRSAFFILAERTADLVWGPALRLRQHFSYLSFDAADVDQYVQEYERHVATLSRFKAWPDDVYTRFLMSTDFFVKGADEGRHLSYLGIYQPYVAPCANPFARFD